MLECWIGQLAPRRTAFAKTGYTCTLKNSFVHISYCPNQPVLGHVGIRCGEDLIPCEDPILDPPTNQSRRRTRTTMTKSTYPTRPSRRSTGLLVAASMLLQFSSVSALSTTSNFGRVRLPNSLFPSLRVGASSVIFNENEAETTTPRLPSAATSASTIVQRFQVIRQSFARVVAILSFAVVALTSNVRPASAWGKTQEVVPVTTTSKVSGVGTKFVKLVVTAGALYAGAASANKVRALRCDTEGSDTIDDQATPLTIVEEVEQKPPTIPSAETPKPIQKNAPPKTSPSNKNVPLVKNLDAKIERLREQEGYAREAAEKARVEQIAKEEDIRRQKDEVSAKIAAIAKEDSDRIENTVEKADWEETPQLTNSERMRLEQIAPPTNKDESRQLVDIDRARKQPKSLEEERELKEKYGKMGVEERAFSILVDLGMVDLNDDPGSLGLEDSDEDDIDPGNVFL